MQTYIDQISFDSRKRSIGANDATDADAVNTHTVVMVPIGSLVFFKLAQSLVKSFHLFPSVNVFNLRGKRRRKKRKKNS